MRVFNHYPYVGKEQRWTVPQGVTSARFECWGAAGGMPSDLAHDGKVGQVQGGSGPRNAAFYNNPNGLGQLGTSFANGAGYAAGTKAVSAGDVFYVNVGGNGGPGHSTIKVKKDGSHVFQTRGGAAGFNGGGAGGKGAHVVQNLYNAVSNNVHYVRNALPVSAKVGQLWKDTGANVVRVCNTAYTSGNAALSKWTTVTISHKDAIGPSGGGGGGATDIRQGANDITGRILVAGGGGGAAGPWNKTGKAAWNLRRVPAVPAPPFGSDTTGTGATGPDKTWATSHNYLAGGWGGGGLGGGTGPQPNLGPTSDGGYATQGAAGGPGTNRHKEGVSPGPVNSSSGKGGGSGFGGPKGHGGSGGQSGSKGNGGNGADAVPSNDDWCAGGGGGGGGYYGGGGGGHGFKVSGDNSDIRTRGGGGGGGSSYVDPSFSAFFLGAGALPPFAKSNSGTGANGLGGFARISYQLPPKVLWTSAPAASLHDANFTATFRYQAARDNGPGIGFYQIGTAASAGATVPTTITTYMVTDSTTTDFSATFTAPAAGVQQSYFVQVIDTDGDASGWLRRVITGLSTTAATPATVTTPASGATFTSPQTVAWTPVSDPQVAFKIGLVGNDLNTGLPVRTETGWRRGGSRVNLATDPGFKTTAVWSSTANSSLTSETAHPGVSGSNGKIVWAYADDQTAEQHTTLWENLIPGVTYRFYIEAASPVANDTRPIEVQVWDANGLLTSEEIDLSTFAANTYAPKNVEFTPTTGGVYVVLVPSATGAGATTYWTDDMEGANNWTATVAGFTPTLIGTSPYQGDFYLQVNDASAGAAGGAQATVTGLPGAGDYVIEGWAFTPTASDVDAALTATASGGGVITGQATGGSTIRNAWVPIRVPFHWNGTGAVQVVAKGSPTVGNNIWYDFITVSSVDPDADPQFGNTDSGQTHYLRNMDVEVNYEEDSGGFPTYFDGTNLNGNSGAVSWSGTVNASASFLTAANVATSSLVYTGSPLAAGSYVYVQTLTEAAMVTGYSGPQGTQPVVVNPSTPATPTVVLVTDNTAGVVRFTINALDAAKTNKTVWFDIIRNGVRIATGLTPDPVTRLCTFLDIPASGQTCTYKVRAIDSAGGYADATTGTVT